MRPDQVVDWLSLVGDSVDNIPGVSGVGPKTATDLLKRFGDIETLLARSHELKSESQRNSVQASADALRRNQMMIRLRDQLAGGPALEDLAPRAADRPVLREHYRRWNFRSLLAELGEEPVPGTETQGDLF